MPTAYVTSDRNGITENRHEIHAAVVDGTGRLLYSVGDALRLTLIRSSVKPAQALAVAESGAIDRYGFDEADIALTCASHSSEDRHIARARSMLAKSASAESDLRCGGHPALNASVNTAWIKNDIRVEPVFSNCSGKHAAFLAAAKAIGGDTDGYNLLNHPIQQRVRRIVEDLCGLSTEEVKWGVDGCNMAAPAVPLRSLAVLNAAFAGAADDDEPDERKKHMARIFHAMAAYPELVGGDGRFCTILMEEFRGQVIGKVGADACYGVGVRESDETKRLGAKGPLAIAVKVEDGNMDIVYAAVAEILEQLQLGTVEMRAKLDSFHHKQTFNTAGVVTGTLAFPFKLRAHE